MASKMKRSSRVRGLVKTVKLRGRLYCKEASLHGVKYVVRESSLVQRVIWVSFVLICLTFGLVLGYLHLDRYSRNRVTTTVSTTSFPIWKVPFPAVTICNFNVVYKTKLREMQSTLKLQDNEEFNSFFGNLSQLLLDFNQGQDNFGYFFHRILSELSHLGLSTEKLMEDLAQPCNKMLKSCSWSGRSVNCSKAFRTVKTSSGICCGFNLGKKERFVNGVGPTFGLEVELNIEENQYFSTYKPGFGFDVKIHSSYDFPASTSRVTSLFAGQRQLVHLRPKILKSFENIRGVPFEIRQCLFGDERKMLWSAEYSFANCMSQCRAGTIQELCGCIPFYYPMPNQTNYCTLNNLKCLQKYDEVYNNLRVTNFEENTKKNRQGCDCLLPCNEISYLYQIDKQFLTLQNDNSTILNVFFDTIGCTKYTRSVYITWDSLLASVGGIFGLCMGGSIFSLIELAYYLLWPNLNKNNTRKTPRMVLQTTTKHPHF